jgi:hypothetical protein
MKTKRHPEHLMQMIKIPNTGTDIIIFKRISNSSGMQIIDRCVSQMASQSS